MAATHGALFTFEPGDTPLGTDLRKWLLADPTPMKPETEALLMLADRSHHVASVITPARVTRAVGERSVSCPRASGLPSTSVV